MAMLDLTARRKVGTRPLIRERSITGRPRYARPIVLRTSNIQIVVTYFLTICRESGTAIIAIETIRTNKTARFRKLGLTTEKLLPTTAILVIQRIPIHLANRVLSSSVPDLCFVTWLNGI